MRWTYFFPFTVYRMIEAYFLHRGAYFVCMHHWPAARIFGQSAHLQLQLLWRVIERVTVATKPLAP